VSLFRLNLNGIKAIREKFERSGVKEMVLKERGYRQVSLPIPLIERIERYISDHKDEGFTSIPEFIRQAIREKIDRSTIKD
jgi:hypothetical protein